MPTIVEIELEVESGLTNNAIEDTYTSMFQEDEVIDVTASDSPGLFQDPVDGEIVNTEWGDAHTFLVDVEKNGELYREYYAFDALEQLADPEPQGGN